MKTSYGLEFTTTPDINESWNAYEKSVARCHLSNYGKIILDVVYGSPIDDEYDLEVIEKEFINSH